MALTSGDVTIKLSGGDYSSLTAFWQDIDDLTGDINCTVDASAFTETTGAGPWWDLNGYTVHVFPASYPTTTDATTGARFTYNVAADAIAFGMEGPTGSVIVEGLVFIAGSPSPSQGLQISGIASDFTLTLRRNIVKGFTDNVYESDADHQSLELYNNILIDAVTEGIRVGYDMSSAVVANNTIVHSQTNGVHNGDKIVTYENNLVYGSSTADWAEIDTGATGNNNADSDNTGEDSDWGGVGSNNVPGISDPFNNLAADDFTITSAGVIGSAGKDLSGTFTTDFFGNTRSNWTIGACEYVVAIIEIAGTADGQSAASGTVKVTREVIGTADGQATAGAAAKVSKKVAGTSDGQATAACTIKVAREIICTADGQSTASCTASITVFIACTSDAQSTTSATPTLFVLVAGTAGGQATADCIIKVAREIICTADGQSAASCTASIIVFIAGTSDAQSAALCTATLFVLVAGTADAQSTTSCTVRVDWKVAGSAAGQSTASAAISATVYIAGTSSGISTAVCTIIAIYTEIPPFMQKDLIDPYSGGAWLWLCEVAVSGYDTKRIARNTEDVIYGGKKFDKFNIQIGEQMFSGDGSIPRVTVRIFQDANRIIEDMINATEGALGAAVKLIRVNEKYLDTPVSALEADYENLAAESDCEWVTFTLGIPNPLTQRVPLWLYSADSCEWATPTLFKGPECQYAGEDSSCTGTYEDCYTKGNAVHWGGELGLDPNVVRV